ncbi:LamB/YcsF family protein [SAR202 cluster bacterium AD-802-E10_MRT_200m]|nr:LamB/YcsF family protein [SAR202 cluster bacterium AD-802-E10_MRT_200m]
MSGSIDLNCDMGEGFGPYTLGPDDQVVRYITSANIACGFHAGDPGCMRRTVEMAEEIGVGVGAHPSFPDLVGFGRRPMSLTKEEARDCVLYQMGALTAFTQSKRLQHVKIHGAMYNMAAAGGDLAKAICDAVLEFDPNLIIIVLAGSRWAEIAREMGMRVAEESFTDRAVNPDGTLVDRKVPGSVLEDVNVIVERAVSMARDHRIIATDGTKLEINPDTLCLHGDTPGAVQIAAAIHDALVDVGVDLVPLGRAIPGDLR